MSTRKIKDAKDLSTNELIYFKGHAQATYMSDGTTVEEAILNIETGGGNANLSDYYTKLEIDAKGFVTQSEMSTAISNAITTTLNTPV